VSNRTTVDVAIVGGGPAGTSAAIALARNGRRVVIVDKARFPRDKCCGDGLTAGALRHLERLGLDPGHVASWQAVDLVKVRSPSGRVVTFPLPTRGTYAAVARRADLDAALVEAARGAGVEVVEGEALATLEITGDVVTLVTDAGRTIDAPYAIGADGAWSTLRKLSAPASSGRPYLGEWHAFRQYLVRTGPAARDLWVWFDPDLLPGYAWSFPLPGGGANVGFGIRREAGAPTAAMAEQWRDLLARAHVRDVLGPDATPEGAHKAWPIPAAIGSVPLTAAGGRVLFIGDAARAADPMTGEGIGQAFDTAELAARAISVAGASAPQVASRVYERGVAAGLAVDNRLASWLSQALSHRRGARGAVRIAGLTPWTRRNFARWLFEDYPRAAVATPRRWRAGMFTGDGAYAA
jgi:geranylgeranyl reductase family protein